METTQIIKENGVYDITIYANKIEANVIAQIVIPDDLGGYTLYGKDGMITQDENGTSITGDIPLDIQPNVLREFNDIVNELKLIDNDDNSIG